MFGKKISFTKTTRFKTTLWYSLLFLILEAVIGAIIYFSLQNSLYKDLDVSLTKQADLIYNFVKERELDLAEFKSDSVYSSPEDMVYDIIFDAVIFNSRSTYVQVFLNNKTIFKTDNLRNNNLPLPFKKSGQSGLIDFMNNKISGSTIREAYLSRNNYDIAVAFPIHLIDETLNSLTDIYIIIAPVFFILSVLGGAVISVRSLSRIDKIIKKTEEITTQNLIEIIPGGEMDDEYGRLVTTMNDMIKRIKTSIEYMNQFTISVSHELKTPLTILRGEIELALKSPRTPEEYKEVLISNYEETLRLISIVDKLFFISKAEHSLIKVNKVKTGLSSFLNNVISQIKPLGREKNIDIILNDLSDKKIEIEIDRELINMALINLIENAIKYGEENKPVCLKLESTGMTLQISVTNKGEAIPEFEIPNIFNKFYRSESKIKKNKSGIGLGLSIVNSIVKWHNGEVKVSSIPDEETIFTIILKND